MRRRSFLYHLLSLALLVLSVNNMFAQIEEAPKARDFELPETRVLRAAYLQEGDSVAVISISSEVEESEAKVKERVKVLEEWGFKVKLGKHLFDTDDGWFSGSDLQRAADLQDAINNKNIKAIIFYRGGYGAVRVVDMIDFEPLSRYPKWLVGYSDITVLHSALYGWGIETIHGQMPSKFLTLDKEEDVSAKGLYFALTGQLKGYVFPTSPYSIVGEVEGRIVGGNLRVLSYINGSDFDIDTEGVILFIEEVAEPMSVVDQMMRELKNSGKLSKVKGIIFGHLTYIKLQERWGSDVYSLMREYVDGLNVPVLFEFPAGHELPNRPIFLGRKAKLKIGYKYSELKFLE